MGGTFTRVVAGWAAVPALAGLALAASVGVVTAAAGRHHRPARRRWFAAAGAVAGLVAAVAVTVGPASATDGERACNGHPELCDRPYDEVVSAATHNAMSSPDIVQVWPEHDGDLRAQLDAGVRALLIDTHYWTPVASPDQLQALDPLLPRPVAELVHQASAPLLQIRPGTFLCHNHCAFGGIELVDALAMVRAFLQENPDEVVTLIIQDAITTEDTAAAMAEAPPFLALTPEQLSCRPNRGRPEAPLFLLNHWVQRVAPDRVDAANLNRLDVIVERGRACADDGGSSRTTSR
jgi:hypothetical protein